MFIKEISIHSYLRDVLDRESVERDFKRKFISRYGKNAGANNSLWHFLFHLREQLPEIMQKINDREYIFSPMKTVLLKCGKPARYFPEARDRMVTSFLFQYLKKIFLPICSSSYFACAGKGRKKAVKELLKKKPHYKYVYKTDVKNYFASIDQGILFRKIATHTRDKKILNLVSKVLTPVTEDSQGNLRYLKKGIPQGVSTSTLFGAIYLNDLDKNFETKSGVYYQRYLDDIVVLAKTNWQLKRAIKSIRAFLSRHLLKARREKTFTGKSKETILYLGYKIKKEGVLLRRESLKKLWENLLQRRNNLFKNQSLKEIKSYLKRWWGAMKLTSIKKPPPSLKENKRTFSLINLHPIFPLSSIRSSPQGIHLKLFNPLYSVNQF